MRPALTALASRQHGVVCRAQLLAAGWTTDAIKHALAVGDLHRVHRGVYAVGSDRLLADGRAMAAALATGPDGGIGAESAAHEWDLRPSHTTYYRTVTRGGARSRPGIEVTFAPDLRDDELTTLRGVPITTPARTLLDMATRVEGRPLMRAIDQARILQLFDLRAFEAVLRHHPRHRGNRALGDALKQLASEPELTRSEKELLFLGLVDEHGLPRPLVNHPIGSFTVDFLFPVERVVVEIDSGQWHTSPGRWHDDHDRDSRLTLARYLVRRFTDRQLLTDPATVAADVIATLADRRRP